MNIIDGLIVAAMLVFLLGVAFFTKRHTHSVSDFLAANRCAGRYMLTIADAMAGVGLVNVLAMCEMYYRTGFTGGWWMSFMTIIGFSMAVSGWVQYRYRETRAMTMAQFFEMRYSRKFRIFSGMLCFVSGVINYGIFPVVTSRVVVHILGLPVDMDLFGFMVPTRAVAMLVILSIAVILTVSGGQVAIMVTDFLQGAFLNIIFIVLMGYALIHFKWSGIVGGIMDSPGGAAMINPLKLDGGADFNIWFFIALAFMNFYGFMSWQSVQGYNCSARTPHEAKMGRVWGQFRWAVLWTTVLIITLMALMIQYAPEHASTAQAINESIAAIPETQIQEQMRIPVTLRHILPVGLLGLVCAALVGVAISTDDSNLHSWSSIFIQDVLMPFRKKPFTQKQHLLMLRLGVLGISIFAFFFGLFFPMVDYLFMFMQVTGAIYVGGAGVAIIGGLYWKRGTTAGAWAGMVSGSSLAMVGILFQYVLWPYGLPALKNTFPDSAWLVSLPEKWPVNGMIMAALFALAATLVYVVVSLLGRQPAFNMDKLLHRGEYAIEGEHNVQQEEPVRGLKVLFKFGREFTRLDRGVTGFGAIWALLWTFFPLVVTLVAVAIGMTDNGWARVWAVRYAITIPVIIIATLWITLGGFKNLYELFRDLKTSRHEEADDGWVADGRIDE